MCDYCLYVNVYRHSCASACVLVSKSLFLGMRECTALVYMRTYIIPGFISAPVKTRYEHQSGRKTSSHT